MGQYEGRYLTEDVVAVLAPFIEEHDRQRPSWANLQGKGGPEGFLSGRLWLAFESGLSETTVRQIFTKRRKTIRGRTADALFTAVGRPDLLTELQEVDHLGRVRAAKPKRKVPRVSEAPPS